MTGEKREFAELLGLFDTTHPEVENERKLALRYLCSGVPIPQTLLRKLERVKQAEVG